ASQVLNKPDVGHALEAARSVILFRGISELDVARSIGKFQPVDGPERAPGDRIDLDGPGALLRVPDDRTPIGESISPASSILGANSGHLHLDCDEPRNQTGDRRYD